MTGALRSINRRKWSWPVQGQGAALGGIRQRVVEPVDVLARLGLQVVEVVASLQEAEQAHLQAVIHFGVDFQDRIVKLRFGGRDLAHDVDTLVAEPGVDGLRVLYPERLAQVCGALADTRLGQVAGVSVAGLRLAGRVAQGR